MGLWQVHGGSGMDVGSSNESCRLLSFVKLYTKALFLQSLESKMIGGEGCSSRLSERPRMPTFKAKGK